jgi:hypothetical protein
MKVYLAGPMTGIPQMNFPAFDAAAKDLRARGYDVVSPAELDDPEDRTAALASEDGDINKMGPGRSWGFFLARDVKLIADEGIEAIVCLQGWQESRGARLETFVARLCDIPIVWYTRGEDLLGVHDTDLEEAHGPMTEGYYPDIKDPGPPLVPDAYADLIKQTNDEQTTCCRPLSDGEHLTVGEMRDVAAILRDATGETRVVNETTGGEKGTKPQRMELLPFDVLMRDVAPLYTAGARKYADHNWRRGYDWSLSFGAMMRHATQFWSGEETDEETEAPHLASVVFHALALLHFAYAYPELDDRPPVAVAA